MAATKQPVRFIGILTANRDAAKAFSETLFKDKQDVAELSLSIPRAIANLKSGKVISCSTSSVFPLERLAKAHKAASYLVKLGADAPEDSVKSEGIFAKVLTAKSDAEVTAVTNQLREEIFGKNAPPITIREDYDDFKVYGQFPDTVSLDEVKQAFEAIGKVESIALSRRGVCRVVFVSKEASAAAREKGVKVGNVAIVVTAKLPKSERSSTKGRGKKEAGAKEAQANNNSGSQVYMKIENVPEELTSKAVKELYAKYGVNMADVNQKAKHCILRLTKAEGVAQILKDKIVTAKGVELVAKPYFPKGAKSETANSNGRSRGEGKPAREKAPSVPAFKIWIDEADPAKCTREQLEALLKGFKGFVSLNKSRNNDSKYTAEYDNPESVQEILKVKEVTCGTAKLSIRAPEHSQGRNDAGAQNKSNETSRRNGERPPRSAPGTRGVIANPPASVTVDQALQALKGLDAEAKVEKGTRSGDFLITFSSPAARDAAIGKDVKIGGSTLKIAASAAASERSEFAVFVPGVSKEAEKDVGDAVKAVVDFTTLRFAKTGAVVGLKSKSDEEKLLAASLKLKDKSIKPEALKKKA